ncbi:MAG: hypothetical protein M1837_005818 [Sclerophora amabilis]|nr:MAG: hypothetical protein M1837_005818 [Sclerophora amabilis]
MDIRGLVSYDLGRRSANSSSSSREMMTSNVEMGMPSYPQPALDNMMPFQPNGYGYNTVAPANYQQMLPNYHPGYSQPPRPHAYGPDNVLPPGMPPTRVPDSFSQTDRNSVIKAEDAPMHHARLGMYENPNAGSAQENKISSPATSRTEMNFATDVDTLMKAIQSMSKSGHQQENPIAVPDASPQHTYPAIPPSARYPEEQTRRLDAPEAPGPRTPEGSQKGKKRYECEIPGCGKAFSQKTHLEIHTRAHTGVKPFSHQNKFHVTALKQLTQKFATIREGDTVSAADKELFEYFKELYKNSNKGIKGRGKDRKIASSGKSTKAKRKADRGGSTGGDGDGDGDGVGRSDSPGSSTASSSRTSQHTGYNFDNSEMEVDDESSVHSAYNPRQPHHYQQQHPLPPNPHPIPQQRQSQRQPQPHYQPQHQPQPQIQRQPQLQPQPQLQHQHQPQLQHQQPPQHHLPQQQQHPHQQQPQHHPHQPQQQPQHHGLPLSGGYPVTNAEYPYTHRKMY